MSDVVALLVRIAADPACSAVLRLRAMLLLSKHLHRPEPAA